MAQIELFGAASCPHTSEMREWLEWRKCEFVEYDVESDPDALARLHAISGGKRIVPALVEDGKLTMAGWQGRGCIVGGAHHA